MHERKELETPDLAGGIAKSELADGEKLLGHVGSDAVLLVRCGDDFFAVGPQCTHYQGPLADGVVADGSIRCPWHHACFDLRTGEALRAPAFRPIACWAVEHREDKVFVQNKRGASEPKARARPLERQGQTAALNMMGHREPFAAVPYFWSQHYDVPINYVGHAESWDEIVIDGDISAKDCVVRFKQEGRTRAIASIYRDRESLQAEISMERQTDF